MAIHTQTKKPKKQKNKKQKKQKDKTQHSASDPLPLGCAILFFLFFLVFWFFGFLVFWFFGFLVFACPTSSATTDSAWQSLLGTSAMAIQTKKPKKQKNKKNKKNKKTRPNTLHLTPSPWGVQSWFFCFFWFFCFLVFWFLGFLVFWFFGLCVDSSDLAHGSELFFLCSRGFWPNCKKPWKNQKNKKFRPMSPARPLPDLAHGSELFFVFSIVVLNVFHVKMLSSQYLSKKCASLQFAHLRPPGQTAKKTMEKPKFINDLYND